LIAFVLLIIPYVYSLECQYKDTETYIENEEVFYYNGQRIGSNLNLSDLVKVQIDGSTIKVTNNLEVPITLNVKYQRLAGGSCVNEQRSAMITVNPLDFGTIEDSCSLSLIKYSFAEPNVIFSRVKTVEKKREVCKQCAGKQCLDDGEKCSIDDECGSSICNIAGYCGNSKTVPCQDGLMNCNNKSCLKPSTKTGGEAYNCIWECKSNKGENGICKWRTIDLVMIISLLTCVIGVASFFIVKLIRRGPIIKGAKKDAEEIINNAQKEAQNIINKAQIALKNINDELKTKLEEKEKLKTEMVSLKGQKEEADKIRKELNKTNEEINILKEKKQSEIKEILESYEIRYGHKFKLENGRIKFVKSWLDPNKEGEFFHIWWFKQYHGKIKSGYDIHHKDFDPLNNDIDNLEEMEHNKHMELHKHRHD
jgi:hypothetical protein